MKKIRLLIISLYYAPEITGNATLITGLANILTTQGYEVTVLAGIPHYRLANVPAEYRGRLYIKETLNGVKVVRCWSYPSSGGILPKMLNYASFTTTSLLAGLFVGNHDLVLVVTPPPWLGMTGLLLKAVHGCPVIYNSQDLFPEAYIVSREVRSQWMIDLLERIQRFTYRHSDRVLVITPSFRHVVAAKGAALNKTLAIPNFINTLSIEPRPKCNPLSQRLGLTDKFVLMYAGNLGYIHGTEILADVAARLAHLPDLRLLVVGDGSKKNELEENARRRQLPNLVFLPPQPDENLADLLATADLLVVTTKKGVGKTSFPSRIYSYMLAGRPIVASIDQDSDAADHLLRAQCGIVTEPEKLDELCEAIESLYHDAARRAACGRRGRKYMEENFSRQMIVDRYDRLLRSTLGT